MAFPTRPLLPFAIVAALAAVACSSEDPSSTARNNGHVLEITHGASTSASPHASGTPSAGASTGGTPGASGSPGTSGQPGTPAPTGSARPKPKTDLTVTAKLAHACVTVGGSQSVQVHVNLPNANVIIDTLYADKKDGQAHGGFKPDGKADANGDYTLSWTVLPGTPIGPAKVFVAAGNSKHRGSTDALFRVAAVC